MRLRLLLIISVLSLGTAPRGLADEGKGTFDEKALDALVVKAMKDFGTPGVAVGVVKDGKVVYLKGHGVRDLSSGKPVTANTLFAIASCTKAMTASAIGALVDDGKMTWDDSVRKHLPEFRLSDALADRDVTIRDLLCHRTGLVGHDIIFVVNAFTAEDLLRRYGEIKLDRPFRSGFGYNNFQYLAAGVASAKAGGTSWDNLIRERIFEPLGMKSACFSSKELVKSGDFARPHLRDERASEVTIKGIEPRNLENLKPAGSINASARDMCEWIRFQLGDRPIGDKRLPSVAALRETHTPQVVAPRSTGETEADEETIVQVGYSLGWWIKDYQGHRIVTHGGSIDGFRANVTLVPREKLGVVVLTNFGMTSGRTEMPEALARTVIDRALNLKARDWNIRMLKFEKDRKENARREEQERSANRKPNTKPSLDLPAYAGVYENAAYGTIRIEHASDALSFRWGSYILKPEHYHHDIFALGGDLWPFPYLWGDRQLSFRLDTTGEVAGMTYLKQEFKKVKPAKK